MVDKWFGIPVTQVRGPDIKGVTWVWVPGGEFRIIYTGLLRRQIFSGSEEDSYSVRDIWVVTCQVEDAYVVGITETVRGGLSVE